MKECNTHIIDEICVKNKFLSELLEKIFDEERLKIFCEHSAGKSMHHSYFGGLLEHTVSVVEICDFMRKRNKLIDRDILITCAILHDVGKIYELNDFTGNNYSDEGELIGHIVIGSDLISKKICEINNFPDDLRLKILHCILSHHGEYEFGSPKLPKTIEALVLHFADDLDAKTKMFEELTENDKSDSNWTSYNKVLERKILTKAYTPLSEFISLFSSFLSSFSFSSSFFSVDFSVFILLLFLLF